ncbi:PACE efflux transporter [Psychrobacter sp. 1U2]|uniref:PACE efflux transporter n=1 Tax=Psychrobacter sp. 1U2 TaxID=3453577 RepID=UPI003F45990F
MRTVKDRIRHTLAFQLMGLITFAPLASWVFGFELHLMGTIAIVGSVTATIWNFIYNVWFDHALLKWRRDIHKTVRLRLIHALLFEVGLLCLLLPFIAWYLNITLWAAFKMDITMATFYLLYAFVYNLIYDKVYPIPQSAQLVS